MTNKFVKWLLYITEIKCNDNVIKYKNNFFPVRALYNTITSYQFKMKLFVIA